MRRVFAARFFTPGQSGFKMRSDVPDTALELIATAELFAVAGRNGGTRSPRNDLLFVTATRNCPPRVTAAIVFARTHGLLQRPGDAVTRPPAERARERLFA